ncbi:MAG: metallophosphoesterase [Tepidibacillus sp.]|uniref:metallophosphoesterase n=1 Tax=Tepidibacillus sp. HK-1 TaxID=1883407 RepID=UPI000852D1CE|nr:metallophosphoesterase [Tepidibacillus sp. HK-1]GBF12634.1 hypothetical protein HK1_02701 [Tepidibacillus sp. HK-1]
MKITVISDTHLPRKSTSLPDFLYEAIEKSDMVIHAGDFTSIDILYDLQALSSRLEAVAGNNDGPEILFRLGKKKIIDIGKYKIGLIHGDGVYGTTLQRAKQAFANEKVDIVIFGHSHQAFKEWENGVLYFNPGSPTDKRRSPKYSYGEIILDDKIQAKIHYF